MDIKKEGLKDSDGKTRLDLIIPEFISGIGEVLTYGAMKYEPNSWQNVKNGRDEHYGAALRHLIAYRSGELNDKETGLSHLYHAATNLMFLSYHERNNS